MERSITGTCTNGVLSIELLNKTFSLHFMQMKIEEYVQQYKYDIGVTQFDVHIKLHKAFAEEDGKESIEDKREHTRRLCSKMACLLDEIMIHKEDITSKWNVVERIVHILHAIYRILYKACYVIIEDFVKADYHNLIWGGARPFKVNQKLFLYFASVVLVQLRCIRGGVEIIFHPKILDDFTLICIKSNRLLEQFIENFCRTQ